MSAQKLQNVFLFVVFAILYLTCKKEEKISRSDLLTKGAWRLTGLISHGDFNGDGVIDPQDKDNFTATAYCTNDDRLTFNIDGSGVYDNGTDTCDFGVPQQTRFTWTFYNPFTGVEDDRVIKFTGFGFDALSIEELNTSTLRTKYFFPGGYHLITYGH